jgi:3-methylfumaryl-CoA hydratase
MPSELDIAYLRRWIGKEEIATETISEVLLARYRATLGQWLSPGDAAHAPLGLHWCLTQPLAAGDQLGPDGHPARGGFLPLVPLPSRMWVGGELRQAGPLPALAMVTRRSVIADVTLKRGRSGPLVFVSIKHEYVAGGKTAIFETQNIVYRESTLPQPGPAPANPPEAAKGVQAVLTPDPVLLFRYSAITFNGHRIHYDGPYACETEGYPGLVVHGPLQATLLLNLAAKACGRVPAYFTYRGLAPCYCGNTLMLCQQGTPTEGTVSCETADGVKTMQGSYQT